MPRPRNSTKRPAFLTPRASHKTIAEQTSDNDEDMGDTIDVAIDTDNVIGSDGAIEQSNTQNNNLQEMYKDVLDTSNKRFAERKAAIHKAYKASHSETKDAITTLFDEHEEEAFAAYNAQLDRLKELIAEKEAIEAEMAAKVERLRECYVAQSKTIQLVVETRIKELSYTEK
ncbi:hypothetical protein BS50DRAFT_678314 [Corynespora cassiicola Philippines]|uniref:Uncharacterized protein n=1 Tax=Corynespora cassiicola Philippines TaxID=1448308 RepID=A0A2T2NJK7_CORCC|nr:hypothetical protein BS50DRAFT_678314 [Corynespora cassiicola Philippines]